MDRRELEQEHRQLQNDFEKKNQENSGESERDPSGDDQFGEDQKESQKYEQEASCSNFDQDSSSHKPSLSKDEEHGSEIKHEYIMKNKQLDILQQSPTTGSESSLPLANEESNEIF